MKDIHSAMLAIAMLGPVVQNGTPSPSGADLQGYNSAEILLGVGVGGITFDETNKIDFVVEHSDDDATYTPVASKDILGLETVTDGIVKSLTEAHAAAGVYRFGYVGGKRYLKVTPTFAGTHGTGTPLSVLVLQGHGHDNPQVDQA